MLARHHRNGFGISRIDVRAHYFPTGYLAALAHVTQCPYCIRGHTHAAVRHEATAEEIMEAIWVAAEMRAGGAYAHSVIALDTIAHHKAKSASDREKVAGVSDADAKEQA